MCGRGRPRPGAPPLRDSSPLDHHYPAKAVPYWERPHQFELAGWVNAAILAVGVPAVTFLCVRLLRASRERLRELNGPGAAAVIAALVGILLLVLRDNDLAVGTTSATATFGDQAQEALDLWSPPTGVEPL
jgi:hypothetical protein